MTSQIEAAIRKQLADLTDVVRGQLNCNVLPYEVKNIDEIDTDPAMQFHLPLLLVELQSSLETIKKTNKPTFICCLPVEIDEMDNLVSPTHGHLSDWDLEAWLEQKVLKTQVLSVGSITQNEHRFRTFKWLVQGPAPQKNQQCDRQRSVEYCELGIQQKRQGNYEDALSYYARARDADFTNPNVYKNSAKVLIGTNRNDEALRHILTYVHLNIATNRYDPNMPAGVFAVPQIDFALTEYDWAGAVDNTTTIPSNYVRSRCAAVGVLQLVAIEIDMTANAGICYARLHEAIITKHRIPHSMFEAQAEIYLGKRPSSRIIRDSEYASLMNVIGFVFLDANLSLEKVDVEEICTTYFDASRALKPISVEETPMPPQARNPLADVMRQAGHTVFELPPDPQHQSQ